jgi:Tfp pilus assembly protein PilX
VALSDREGFALVAAVMAVVMIGALVVGVLFATTEDARTGAAGIARDVALNACETAIVMTVTDPEVALPDSIGVAGTLTRRFSGVGTPVIVYITRLDSALYSVVADVVAGSPNIGSSRRLGVVIKTSTAADHSITIDPISERAWFEVF